MGQGENNIHKVVYGHGQLHKANAKARANESEIAAPFVIRDAPLKTKSIMLQRDVKRNVQRT